MRDIYRQSERITLPHKIVRLWQVVCPFGSMTLFAPVFDTYDYSAPTTSIIGRVNGGEIVGEIERRYPGIFVQLPNGETGWITEWDLERVVGYNDP